MKAAILANGGRPLPCLVALVAFALGKDEVRLVLRFVEKFLAVRPLLRGADLETLSRRYAVTAATLSTWRETFLAGSEAV